MSVFSDSIKRLEEDIKLRNFSDSTFKAYVSYVIRFIVFTGKRIEDLNEEDIRKYLLHLITFEKKSASTINCHNCAIRFFFVITLNRSINLTLVPKQKKSNSLPGIFSVEEMKKIFEVTDDLKDRVFIMLGYGSGLRVDEIRNIKIQDIKSSTMQVFVEEGKGKKDRYTILSQECLEELREYWKEYRKGVKEGYLFIGEDAEGLVCAQTIRRALAKAMKKVSIDRGLSTHTLRHSFATHLYESGVDILVIQILLGHASPRTTNRYIKIANATEKITSPLDRLKGGDAK